jgi:hypothetical protein
LHYFSFSTTGQWLWDEIRVVLPPQVDSCETALKIREIVARETQAEAAKKWQRVTDQHGTRTMSAVNLRPCLNGLEVVVRHIARAPQRYAVKSKFFQANADPLRKQACVESVAG